MNIVLSRKLSNRKQFIGSAFLKLAGFSLAGPVVARTPIYEQRQLVRKRPKQDLDLPCSNATSVQSKKFASMHEGACIYVGVRV